jgi:chromosome segregation protein
VAAAEERHRVALRESQERQARARQLANEQGSARGRLEAAERLCSQIVSDIQRITEQISSGAARVSDIEAQRAKLEAELAEMTSERETELQSELEKLNAEYSQLEPVRKESRQRLSAASQGLEESRRTLDRIKNIISQGLLDAQRLELEIENRKERLTGEYGAEILSEVLQLVATGRRLSAQERDSFADEAEKLKARVLREGEVDPTTIDQYQVERVRLEELEAQRVDLESAIETLKQTVAQLTHTSQERFLATFTAVRDNFARLIPQLFGGGKGTLELTDPQRPLESGVEIVARPPGKKLKSIELMSGGEKALCATGLIFSMFLVRPSPLCVLDEVDAPLDDANLVRLLSMIKEMSRRTQFIMITHNKQSMSAASNLVGVTMQEPGATRIITVSLQEAFKQSA